MDRIERSEIGWSRYLQYEGPFWRGRANFKLPEQPNEAWRQLAVITATEGGHFDSYNGYDKCDCTSGLVQWCDHGQYSVCDMLGAVMEVDPGLMLPVIERCDRAGVQFKKNGRGRWRYFFGDERGEVDRAREQDQLYHGGSTGHRGTWDADDKDYAKDWAAAISSVWLQPEAQQIQIDFTVKRLGWFVGSKAKPIFKGAPDTHLGHAFRAAFISYAANNPSWAQKHLLIADATQGYDRYSMPWLMGVLQQLTFGPNVTIYPHRYNAIRPVLERLYGIDLPDFARELVQWESEHGAAMSVTTLQVILKKLGKDLGTSGENGDGIDGVPGGKTRAAVRSFQSDHGLNPTGYPDPATRDALVAARDAIDAIEDEAIPPELKAKVRSLVATTLADMARRAVADARPT